MREPLDLLERDIRAKLAELAQTIALAQAGQVNQAIAIVRSDAGKAAMDAARVMFTDIIDAADGRLRVAVDIQRDTGSALRWVSIGGGLIIFGVVGAFALTGVSYTRALVSARAQVEGINAGLESRVAERTQDLGRANEEIQRFAYIVTHDLRAPLVNIMGFTSELEASVVALTNYMAERDEPGNVKFAEAKLAATEDLPEAITFIRAATKKMDRLINAILKISREGRRQLRPEPINLEEMINASAAAIQHQVIDRGGELVTNVRVPRLVSDKMSLEHVLGNLLDNAVKYYEPSRPLRIEVRARSVAGNRIEIEVEDNGRGIAATDHERVFELFRRSGLPDQPGEGIGLPHVRTMARSLGGDIALRSELGVGTSFTITLPRDLRSHLGSQKT
jgi:signal transduction histidine kinase